MFECGLCGQWFDREDAEYYREHLTLGHGITEEDANDEIMWEMGG